MNAKVLLVLTCICLLIAVSAASKAKDININLTYNGTKLVWTPPGPYSYVVGDMLKVTNKTGFQIRVSTTTEDGTELSGSEVPNGYTGGFPLATGFEAWVCIEYEAPGIRSAGEECEKMDLVKELPTTTEWGLLILTLLLMTAGVVTLVRRRRA